MSIFQILLVIGVFMIVAVLIVLTVVVAYRLKLERSRAAILSHRELWIYYLSNPELDGLLGNNNGKDITMKIDPENLTEKQYRFLVLFLNHMESMLPSYKKYEKDWVGLFKNPALRKVYESTKLYRNKRFCKLIDSIISSYTA